MSRVVPPAEPKPGRVPKPAPEAVGDMKMSDAGRALVRPDITGVELFDRLVKARLFPDAVRLIARALTPPEVVWWGCLCVWAAPRPEPAAATEAAVRAAVAWLRDPTDDRRRTAGAVGSVAGPTTPAGLIATAAFLADGSISPPDQPAVKADPHLPGTLVAEAVLGLSRAAGPDPDGGPLVRQFLAIAVEVFRGANTPAGKP